MLSHKQKPAATKSFKKSSKYRPHKLPTCTTRHAGFQSTISDNNASSNVEEGPVRVRFAPSPTGTLHLGGLRTALYNYLFTKNRGGECILRIEDTDRTRLVPGAMESLISDMHWVGIQYDEGPDGIKKTPGAASNNNANPQDTSPYIQSQRFHLYQEGAKRLLDSGHAYRCFCTPERLEQIREFRAAKGEPQIYDRLCAGLTPAETAERVEKGEKHVVRMKMPDGTTFASDLVRGEVKFQNHLIDDQVLIKSDGFPTYHLANIIDDHSMGITHVIRGEEWLPSLPKHLALYEMFGWQAPQFAHLPLLLREDGGKLSKRFRDSSLNYYVEMGYLPEAIINFVALLGWHPTLAEMEDHARRHGVDIKTDDAKKTAPAKVDITKMDAAALKAMLTDDKTKLKQKTSQLASTVGGMSEVFTVDELAHYFDINNIQKSGATVELNKLNFFHSQHWKRALSNDISRLESLVVPHVHNFIKKWKNNDLTEEEKQMLGGIDYTTLSYDPTVDTSTNSTHGYPSPSHLAAFDGTLTGEGKNYTPNKTILTALKTTRDHPCTLTEFPGKAMFIFAKPDLTNERATLLKDTFWVHHNGDNTEPGKSSPPKKNTTVVLNQLLDVIQQIPDEQFDEFDVTSVIDVLKKYSKAEKVGLKEIYQPLRFCLSGKMEGVGVADQLCAIGKTESIARIQHALSLYGDRV